jgi:hypothetical protein
MHHDAMPPLWLGRANAARWRWHVQRLSAAGRLPDVDAYTLATLVRAEVQVERCRVALGLSEGEAEQADAP